MRSTKIAGRDITGLVFGRLTALYQIDRKAERVHYWHCLCTCGNTTDVLKGSLTSGTTKSCGCGCVSIRDITGLVSGRLTVLYQTQKRNRQGTYYWHCQCECGNTTDVPKYNLVTGHSKSCGCLREEINTKHGCSTKPLCKVLYGMIARCYNLNDVSYRHYGERGITVCQEWLDSPRAFIEWGEANGYKKGLQIDRMDNDGNYEPSNCRFVTCKENTANRRCTVYVLLNNEKTPATYAAVELGIPIDTIYRWVKKKRVSDKYSDVVTLIESTN